MAQVGLLFSDTALIHNSFFGFHHTAGQANWSIVVSLLWDLPFLQNGDRNCFLPDLWQHFLFPAVGHDLDEFSDCCIDKVNKHVICHAIWFGRLPWFHQV